MKVELVAERVGIYGGLKRMYKLAGYLIEEGHQAVVNIASGETTKWFTHLIPENQLINPDIRIMPEPWQKPHPAAVNLLYVQAEFDPPDDSYDGIITTTDYLAGKIRKEGFEPSAIIPYGFDSSVFTDNPSTRVSGRVGYMPRKNSSEAEIIKSLCPDIEFVALDGLDEQQVVEELQKCDVFLLLSRVEGFGMTGFEAALCGCLLVGYHGYGGEKWLTEDTCVLTNSPQEIAARLPHALYGVYENRRENAKRLVLSELTPEIEKNRWITFLEKYN